MLYPSGMLVARPAADGTGALSYTKHYFAGTQRVSSKIGTTTNLGKFLQEWTLIENSSGGAPINLVSTSHDQLTVAETGVTKVYTQFGITPTPTFNSNSTFLPVSSFTATGTETEIYFFHPDHLGSSNYITNFVGEVSQHMEYFAFGETFIEEHKNSHNSPYKFNGKELDEESGLYYYGARYYDPRISIWASVDPLMEMFAGRSPYEYCFSNPLNLVDPTGMGPEKTGPTPKQSAQMSADVYNTKYGKYKKGEKASKIDGGWTLSKKDFGITLTEDKSGFNSAIYERNIGTKKNPKMEYTYVTQGSDFDNKGIDWAENGNQAMGKYSRQYELSTNNARKLQKIIGKELSFSGHSLGGGLASANALATGLDATTFNAAGLHKNTKSRFNLNMKANIQAYIVQGEIVSQSQSLLGLKAEGVHTYLPATYIPLWTVRFAPPPVKAAAIKINLGISAYNHTMGSVLSKMK